MVSDFVPRIDTKGKSTPPSPSDRQKWPRRVRIAFASAVAALSTYLGGCIAALLVYSVTFPPVTGVQLQHSVESLLSGSDPRRVYVPISLSQMDESLPRAVVAGEDSRFFRHRGIDWKAVNEALDDYQEGKRLRGGSSITQQLVKNLFMTTHRTVLRKALEVPLAYAAELLLSKRRILELYINIIEWGPGVYGVEAASHYYYGRSASTLTHGQAAALAACIPNPRERHPAHVDWYRRIILRRMHNLGPLPLPSNPPGPHPPSTTSGPPPSETNRSENTSATNPRVDTAVVESSSDPDSLDATDTVPLADSLPTQDTVHTPGRVATPNDTSGTDSLGPRDADSLQRATRPTSDSTDTP